MPVYRSHLWQTTPVANGAEILTLFVSQPSDENKNREAGTVPILAVLRDSLGDPEHRTDRLRYVWILSSSRPTFQQEALSAIPFFHWHVNGRKLQPEQVPRPVVDLGNPTQHFKRQFWSEVIEFSTSHLLASPLRALPKPYLSNHSDHVRLKIIEAVSILQRAGVSEGEPLSRNELDTIIGRLILSKTVFGRLTPNAELPNVQRAADVRRETSRARNFELLRSSAERVGLYFEPINLGGESATAADSDYGLLWFPLYRSYEISGTALADKTWHLLQISNPANGRHLIEAETYRQVRSLDQYGRLLAAGEDGPATIELVPIAMYSLTYPRMPLLLIDFLHPTRIRHKELTQRLVREIGGAGLYASSFPGWAFSGALGLYQYIKRQQGSPTDEQARLDCYSKARMDLALSSSLDADFRSSAQARLNEISINPLDSAVDQELAAANISYSLLMQAAASPNQVPEKLDKDRRQELASFGASNATKLRTQFLRYVTLGLYTRRAQAAPNTIESVRQTRRVNDLLNALNHVGSEKSRSELTFNTSKIVSTIQELSTLTRSSPPAIRHSFLTIADRLLSLSEDESIREQCIAVLAQDGKHNRAVTKRSNRALVPAKTRVSKATLIGELTPLRRAAE